VAKRTLRLSLMAATVLILPGVSPAAGQSEPPLESEAPFASQAPLDPMGASYWTGTWTGPTVEASDPRISGEWVEVDNRATYPDRTGPGGSFSVNTASLRIENADGAWAGTFTGIYKGDSGRGWNVLEGEGAYEGLTAVFLWTWPGRTLEGVILPAAFPAAPDPIAPFSE
jgi:hypothetical protein